MATTTTQTTKIEEKNQECGGITTSGVKVGWTRNYSLNSHRGKVGNCRLIYSAPLSSSEENKYINYQLLCLMSYAHPGAKKYF